MSTSVLRRLGHAFDALTDHPLDLLFGAETRGPGLRTSHPGPKSPLPLYFVGRAWLRAAGWRLEGELPRGSKWVMIAAPHTSGWDLPFMLATAFVFRVKLNWLGKHSLFSTPLKRWFMTALGGIPVDRRAPQGLVAQVVEKFTLADGLFLAVPPAGTRSSIKCWKSGFYHIAKGAEVPVLCGFLDFERKVCGVGPTIELTGDVKTDMDKFRDFYEGMGALYPDRKQPVVLKEELTDEELAALAAG